MQHQSNYSHYTHTCTPVLIFVLALLSPRSLLPHVSARGPGHPGHDQRDLVSWQGRPLLHHQPDVLARTCQVPHPGHPLPDGMHHLRHQLQRQPGGHQQHGTHVGVQISWILIQWGQKHTHAATDTNIQNHQYDPDATSSASHRALFSFS